MRFRPWTDSHGVSEPWSDSHLGVSVPSGAPAFLFFFSFSSSFLPSFLPSFQGRRTRGQGTRGQGLVGWAIALGLPRQTRNRTMVLFRACLRSTKAIELVGGG